MKKIVKIYKKIQNRNERNIKAMLLFWSITLILNISDLFLSELIVTIFLLPFHIEKVSIMLKAIIKKDTIKDKNSKQIYWLKSDYILVGIILVMHNVIVLDREYVNVLYNNPKEIVWCISAWWSSIEFALLAISFQYDYNKKTSVGVKLRRYIACFSVVVWYAQVYVIMFQGYFMG